MLAPRRVLVLRLDRLGDVVLTLPLLQVLRERFPHAYIAAMVQPACADVVRGHPAVNEVLVYDKTGKHHGWNANWRFARRLRKMDFDTAIAAHPSARSHVLPWLAGIPVRIGWDWKGWRRRWPLTHALPHRKQQGARTESDYTLELLQPFGITIEGVRPKISVQADAAERMEQRLREAGWAAPQPLLAIHPSASCVSKRWMPERFAAVADRFAAEGFRICLVAGPDDVARVRAVQAAMRAPAVDLSGRLSVAELAALLARCRLLISNDSGPVHVAAAVGTPTVDIFGRNAPALSPRRWGPAGPGHVVLQKDVGCVVCLAHNCDIEFKCLTTLQTDEVYQAATALLSQARAPSN